MCLQSVHLKGAGATGQKVVLLPPCRIRRTISSECRLIKPSCSSHWPILANTRTRDHTVSIGAGITPDAPVLTCDSSKPSAIYRENQQPEAYSLRLILASSC